MDLRDRVVAAVEAGGPSRQEAAARFGVGISTAIRWLASFGRTGSAAPGWMGGYRPRKLVGEHRNWLIERCTCQAFILRRLVAELGERGLKVDYRLVWAFVHEEKLSFEKTLVATEQDRPDVARRRTQWRRYQHQVDPARLVFIDG